jgi:hypothetical protein
MGAAAPSRSRRRFVTIVIVVLLGLVVAELLVRARYVERPRSTFEIPEKEVEIKAGQLDRLRGSGARAVYFLGSSAVDVAIDPSRLRAASGDGVKYNAATMGATLRIARLWAESVVLQQERPRVVVVGVTSRDMFAGRDQRRFEARFLASPTVHHFVGGEGLLEKSQWYAGRWSELVRYRASLREAGILKEMVGLTPRPKAPTYFAPDGQLLALLSRSYTGARAARNNAFFTKRVLDGFSIGDAQVSDLRRLLALLRSRAEHVVLLSMPVTKDYIRYHPRGRADYDSYLVAVRGEAKRADVAFMHGGIWPDRFFADPVHMNRQGSIRITDEIDRVLADL